jgi:hypothetical protein
VKVRPVSHAHKAYFFAINDRHAECCELLRASREARLYMLSCDENAHGKDGGRGLIKARIEAAQAVARSIEAGIACAEALSEIEAFETEKPLAPQAKLLKLQSIMDNYGKLGIPVDRDRSFRRS